MTTTAVNDDNFHGNENENFPERRDLDKASDNFTTKNILLYKNGDLYFPGKRIVVNTKYIRNWESFLEELTKNLNPRNGAIRDVRTPFHGTRIRSLDDLTANGKYVAVSKGENLKILDYSKAKNINSPPQQAKSHSFRLKPLKTATNDVEKIESRITQQLYVKSSIINIFRNGDPFTRAIKVVIKPHEQKHMNILVRAIEDRVLLKTNQPIRRIYTLNGDLIKYAKDIEDGQYYVAASHEPFENIKYGQYLPVIRGGRVPSKRTQIKFLNQLPTPREEERTQRTAVEDATDRSEKQLDPSNSRPKNANNRPQKTNSKSKSNSEIAATKIQAAFRGFHTRKEIEKAKETNEPLPKNLIVYVPKKQKAKTETEKNDRNIKVRKDEKPKNSEQKSNKPEDMKNKERKDNNDRSKYRPKKEIPTRKKVEPSEIKNVEDAAIIIQAGFRGYMTRRNLKNRVPQQKPAARPKEQKNESKTPNNLQKTVPPRQQKNENKSQKNGYSKEKAATIIQAGFRGFKTRQNLRQIVPSEPTKPNKEKKVDSKTSNEPKKEETKNSNEDAAVKIQAAFRGFKTRENLKVRYLAATKIQAGFRGYKTRRNLRKEKPLSQVPQSNNDETDFNNKETQELAAIRIQAGFRGYKTRKEIKEHERENAAEKIQAGFRGYKTRKLLHIREEAAIKIQAAFRGYQTRRKINDREKAAEKIQAGYRSFKTRNQLMSNPPKYLTPEEQAQERNEAATRIQAAFRGYIYRRENM